jgi:asparagine synthase (glutamine-hydrolysing)
MCGIAGIISVNPLNVNTIALRQMTDALQHRGPDGEGHWISQDNKVGLGHRRLSIIDLSNEAAQPMHYMDRYSMVFNGEIYNYIELKETLIKNGYQFRTASDTEVLMAYYDWKKEACLSALDGMFAFAIYDNREKKLFCARDRFGEKPFYYHYKKGEAFYFGSEMKALWAAGIPKEVNNEFVYNYIANGNIADPSDMSRGFYKNILNLQPATYLYLDLSSIEIKTHRYWEINTSTQDNGIPLENIEATFASLLEGSVNRRLRSDVPVGSSLSGGLDSSLIVCLINKMSNGKLNQNTFSARFPGFKKDEGDFIQLVLKHTNVTPHFVYPDQKGFIDNIDKLCYHQEEPFGSSSIYAQYCVMQLAKENNVTVLLDGQGADEILGGYHSYFPVFFGELKQKSRKAYQAEKSAYDKMFSGSFNHTAEPNPLIFAAQQHAPVIVHLLKKYRQGYRQKKDHQFTSDFFRAYKNDLFKDLKTPEDLNGLLKQQAKADLQFLLRFADRNSMAHGREVRLPFLDFALVEFIFSLPASYKIKDGWTKWLMRTTFDSLLPKEIAWRKDKIGFEPPQQSWMENPHFKEMLFAGTQTLVQHGILDKKVLDKPMTAHQVNAGAGNYSWRYLMAGKMFSG